MTTTCVSRIGIGARGQVAYGEEKCYGVAVPPVKRIDFVSESIANSINALVSNALQPSRAVPNIVRGNSNIGGDIAYEQNSTGHGVWMKHSLGNAITLPATDGGIRAQLGADATIGQTGMTLRANNVSPSLPAAGYGTIVSRDSAGNLVSDQFRWTSKSDGTVLLGVTGLGINCIQGDRLFLTDSTTYVGVYTHYLEAGRTLPTGLTVEVGRDIVYFTYTGCRVNQLAETFNAGDILTGTWSVIGRAEASGADTNNAHVAGDTTVTLKTGSFLLQDGTGLVGFRQRNAAGTMLGSLGYYLQIEGENDITYTGYTVNPNGSAVIYGIPSAGTGSITKAHAAGVPIAPQSTAAETALVPTTQEPLISFQAGMYMDSVFQEVLSASYTLNNNLFADKYQLGDRFRAQLPEQKREVTGTISTEFDDLVLYRKFVNSVAVELEIRIVDDGAFGLIGNTGVYRQKHIIFTKIKYSGSTPVIGGPDVIKIDGPFQAFYDTADDEPEMIMILVNSVERDIYGV
jgi:hypothetical protein